MRPQIAGNWKMHGLRAELTEIESIAATAVNLSPDVDILVCPVRRRNGYPRHNPRCVPSRTELQHRTEEQKHGAIAFGLLLTSLAARGE
jgi:hypothetical protein